MHRRSIFALVGAILILVLAPSGSASAAGGTAVTVRVEGKARTLLAPTVVKTHSGWITKGATPRGKCAASSAAGALDVATHHRWGGKFYTSFSDYLIKTILGDSESGASHYWGIWIDNKFSTTGACSTKLRRGDQLLFAVDSTAHHEHPLAFTAPSRVAAGHSFSVKVVWFSDSGVKKPLAGVRITTSGASAVTKSNGTAHLTARQAGTLVLGADRSGYIRAAPVRVRVMG